MPIVGIAHEGDNRAIADGDDAIVVGLVSIGGRLGLAKVMSAAGSHCFPGNGMRYGSPETACTHIRCLCVNKKYDHHTV